jgi:magnesium transporter
LRTLTPKGHPPHNVIARYEAIYNPEYNSNLTPVSKASTKPCFRKLSSNLISRLTLTSDGIHPHLFLFRNLAHSEIRISPYIWLMINPFKSKTENSFEWIDIVNPTNEELLAIGAKYKLDPSAIRDCMEPEHLPKYELFDDIHFIICRYYDADADKYADSIQELTRKLAIFFTKDLLITIHRKEFNRLTEVVEKYKDHNLCINVVCKIIKASLESYEAPVNKLDMDIDFYESRIFLKKRIPDLLKNLYVIKRKMYVMRKLNNITKDIIEKVTSVPSKKNPVLQDLKDSYVRTDTMIEEAYDSIHSLLNIYISLSSQRTNEVMRTLTVFTAFFLPLTFIVGVYGMNFHFMPELDKTWGYPAVLGLMLGVTIAVYVWFKRKGWM